MKTLRVRLDPDQGPWPELATLAATVREGGLVAFPTETVYGIAVNARDEAAIRRLYQAKGRPDAKPLTVHLASGKDLLPLVRRLDRPAAKLVARFWPGPVTLVIPDRHRRMTGYRVPDLAVAREFIRLADCRVAASSANLSGQPAAVNAEQVLEHFDGLVDAVIDGGPCRHEQSSTVVRVTGDHVEVLREGAVPAALIREATAKLLLFVCAGDRCRGPLTCALATTLLARRLGTDPDQLLARGYRLESAGTDCLRGQPPSPEALAIATDWGCDLQGHQSRPLTPSLVEDADRIFVMTVHQRASILEFAPEAADRIHALDRTGADIPDPAGSGPRAHRQAAERIHRALQSRLDDL